MKDNYAVFYYNEDGDLEKLTIWMTLAEAKFYRDNEKYFAHYKKIILMMVED